MKKINKIISLFMIGIFMLSFISGCANEVKNESIKDEAVTEVSEEISSSDVSYDNYDIRIAGLSGPTSMGLSKLLTDNNNHESKLNYDFTLAGSADQITPLLVNGDLDIACVPANLASILYNRTNGKIKVLAINTLGVIYVVERGNSINSIEDLKDKTIYISGKGQTPEFLTRYLLEENGLNPDTDVNLIFKTEHQEIVSVLKNEENAIAVLPQPFLTIAKKQISDLRVAIDTTKEYNKINDNKLITGVAVANVDFIANNKEKTDIFLSEYEDSVTYVNNNTESAAEMIGNLNIFSADVAKAALPECNIYFEKGENMKNDLSSYLNVLYNQYNNSIGGNLPNDDFYYIGD